MLGSFTFCRQQVERGCFDRGVSEILVVSAELLPDCALYILGMWKDDFLPPCDIIDAVNVFLQEPESEDLYTKIETRSLSVYCGRQCCLLLVLKSQ